MKILSIFGTRPEALKMAPLLQLLGTTPGIESVICSTGQHQEMLRQVMDMFKLGANHELNIMRPDQSLNGICAGVLAAMDPVLRSERPDRVLVHGDTSTAMAASLAAFHHQIPVAHVEAGLRTHDLTQPWPEEMNRRVVDVVSDIMFAPTRLSKKNLLAENLHGKVLVTGNTILDTLRLAVERINCNAELQRKLDDQLPRRLPGSKLLLVTGHRRENFGEGFAQICDALTLLARRDDVQIVYPVHLNPHVRGPVLKRLRGLENVQLVEPLNYLQFVRIMQMAQVILTDSGGVQEEAPWLGKPVLVMRDVTERPEAVEAGTVQLVGTDAKRIVSAVAALLDDPAMLAKFSMRQNPYGDGYACQRIVACLTGQACEEFLV